MARGWLWSLCAAALACGHRPERALDAATRQLGQAVTRGDASATTRSAIPSLRPRLDTDALLTPAGRRAWGRALARPSSRRVEGLLLSGWGGALRVVSTERGWRFGTDPEDFYRQDSPRSALQAFVLATRMERWDVVVGLAPRRFRIGLSSEDLAQAWTKGQYAQALRDARDQVAVHLDAPLVMDAHEAVMTISRQHRVRLEREFDRWVVVDFLPVDAASRD